MKELGPVDPERFSLVARFFTDAMIAGAHLEVPEGMKPEVWEQRLDRAILYYFGKHEDSIENPHETRTFSLQEVGKILPGKKGPLTKERIRQIIEGDLDYGVIEDLYQNCPSQVKAEYLLDHLVAQSAKPEFLTGPRGITRRLIEDLDAGKDYESLVKKYSPSHLSVIRKDLKDYGIKVPFKDVTMGSKKQ